MAHDDPIPELKRQLAQRVVERLSGWSQVYAASFLGTDQPRMSDLRRGRLERFSLEQLIRFVSRVEGTVRIDVEWSTRRAWLFAPVRIREQERKLWQSCHSLADPCSDDEPMAGLHIVPRRTPLLLPAPA